MKKTLADGTVLEGSAEELAEYEKKLKEEGKSSKKGKKDVLLGQETNNHYHYTMIPCTRQHVDVQPWPQRANTTGSISATNDTMIPCTRQHVDVQPWPQLACPTGTISATNGPGLLVGPLAGAGLLVGPLAGTAVTELSSGNPDCETVHIYGYNNGCNPDCDTVHIYGYNNGYELVN